MELAIHLLHCHFLSHLESTRYDEIIDFFFLYILLLFMGVNSVIPLNERMLLSPPSSFPARSVCVVIPDVNTRTGASLLRHSLNSKCCILLQFPSFCTHHRQHWC